MLKNFFDKYMQGNKRTVLLKKNILGSFFIKGWTCLVQLILVPVTLDCLNQYEYGIWLTISSLLIWIDSFDIGLGNGLRNLLAESIAKNDLKKGQQQVSTAFFMLVCIILPTIPIFTSIVHKINCYKLFNVDPQLTHNLEYILIASYTIVAITFIFKFIGNIYMALQLPAITNLLIGIGHTISLFLIYTISRLGNATLFHVAVIYTISPLIVYLFSYPITFTKYKYLTPSIRLFDYKELKPLFGLGIKFFLAQISGMVIFASSNILISRLFSPKEVTPYQIAYRYFGMVNIIFTLISAPLWSATTNAYTQGDTAWISNAVKKMRKIIFLLSFLLIIMIITSQFVYSFWVGDTIEIPLELSISMACYMFVIIYGTCYSNIICGMGKIQLITIITIIEALCYIPMALFLGKYLGVYGIVAALIFVNSISAITNHLQYRYIISERAYGLWNK
ncbi:polysaccharide biosynthesis protein [Hallella bergensis DSM 17361]|uniref:Polysaccharide biosynthesis protein n=1 Tax=Hallella bergensis DSM 17361 TaxID=585502 RepID=D1PXM4_9BACT|nr:MATE family efflux transporter [Hallella bergensis]EFA43848.1 polysaccharide biosynthesis protein [Hallella bergensis DSM 17361]